MMTLTISPFALSAVVAVCVFSQAASLSAADADNTALDTVAQKDSTLRAALSTNDKAEREIREKFGKQLDALRKTRLQALEQAFSRASTKRDTEAVATLATSINNLKSEAPSEPASLQDEEPLVGTTFRWGSFVMFLAPDGVSWFVNMDAERDVHRFSWNPAGTNKIKWRTTDPDPKKQNVTISINGNECLVKGDETGSEEKGKVFKP